MTKYNKDGSLKRGFVHKDNPKYDEITLGNFVKKGTCQICHQEYEASKLINVWFKTDIGIVGRIHGVCTSCDYDIKIRDCITAHVKQASSKEFKIIYLEKKEYR